jgi:hypothetical protein
MEYTENHHIVPKSLGGDNSSVNLVKLTAREHYLCHLLLTKMVSGEAKYKMYFAFGMMMTGHKKNRYAPPSRFYSIRRSLVGKAISFFNKGRTSWNAGIPRTESEKINISKSLTGRIIGPHSTQHNEKLSESNKGKHQHEGDSNPMFGKKQSADSKEKMRLAKINAPKTICEHCSKSVVQMSYKRWHGDNCKSLITYP